MKKLLLPITILFVILITISSCKKEEECTLCGTYNGNIVTNDTLRIHVSTFVNLDTMFTTMASKAIVKEIEGSNDSMSLTVSLELAGKATDVVVNAYKASETKLVIKNAKYNYDGILDLIVNGTFQQDGDKATANVILSKSPTLSESIIIDGNLSFTGTK